MPIASVVLSRSHDTHPCSYFESLSTSGPGPSNTSYAKVSDWMQNLLKEIPRLILYNANVITVDPSTPRATGVVCEGGVITSTSGVDVERAIRTGEYEEINCEGRTVLPGFIDAHVHFLAYASSLTAVDCSPQAVASIPDITAALSERARNTPECEWVRGTGYDEFRLREKRHPTRWDLDPFLTDHPVKLGHRSGHGTVLNSRALDLGRDQYRDTRTNSRFYRPGHQHGRAHGAVHRPGRLAGRAARAAASGRGDGTCRSSSRRCLSCPRESLPFTTHLPATPSNGGASFGHWSRAPSLSPVQSLMPGFAALEGVRRGGVGVWGGG